LLLAVANGMPGPSSISSVSVTMRGKRYEIEDATTVQDLQEQIEQQSGVAAKQQGRVIFGGKKLSPETVLADAGVPAEGGQLNMVPSTGSKKKKSSAAAAAAAATTASSTGAGSSSQANAMADYLKQSGIDTSKLDDMMKSMGGGDGPPPSMEEGMKAMTEAMNSPLFQQMMSDPERLEQSRQMILGNPMLKSMMAGMPGMENLLNDPDAWREAMQAAAELYKSMDSETLMKAMLGGATGMPPPGGLFDGTLDESTSRAAAALDELDEDD
jgi:Ubiquitin family